MCQQTWGGWGGLKEDWAPTLETALNSNSESADKKVPTVSIRPKRDTEENTEDRGTAVATPGRNGQTPTGANGGRGALLGFIAGGVCMAAVMMLARRSARL